MTFPTREDRSESDVMFERWRNHPINRNGAPKPRLDWLLLTVLVADLGVWVGLLAWWIWR